MIIECRKTKHFGETRVIMHNYSKTDIEVDVGSMSRSGRHWIEEIHGTGRVTIKDVTNTGKHNCRMFEIKDGKMYLFLGSRKDSSGKCCCDPTRCPDSRTARDEK